ncbi:hypothetical protein CC1G_14052 [Coprinopsis cinerea okayama7|uniref:Uncharacterized protein n=1 Tax=Coprinopsis cinerea (strain Okayama-7 / 130 / ATCC MYA-4618 / FGSC 9003) TaxID=240176 RepID=D6RL28_COPC7|nr:hypothetical protein CC1G_14052 [Coprinopsis cinerea okayama7\|eukprot:XP_002912014.1 hypothetical protein CC1G_14052 [Coprinopsis cinerea okayama7\
MEGDHGFLSLPTIAPLVDDEESERVDEILNWDVGGDELLSLLQVPEHHEQPQEK